MKFLALPFLWPIYVLLFISTAFPTSVGNFDFVHISKENSLTLNIPKNSPPIAALRDEQLPELKTEPAQPMAFERNSRVLVAGTKSAWPKLQKVSKDFEKSETLRQKRRQFFISQSLKYKAPIITKIETETTAPQVATISHKPSRISELIRLVEPVNQPARVDVVNLQKGDMKLEPNYAAGAVYPVGVGYIPPIPKREPAQKPKSPLAAAPAPAQVRSRASNSTASTAAAVVPTPSEINRALLPPGSEGPMIDSKKPVHGFDGGEGYFVAGQVELTGGLAAVKGMNKLQVQWKTGLELIDADVDANNGKFAMNIPNLAAGKIFATLLDNKENILGRGIFDLDGVTSEGQTSLEGIKIIIDPLETNTRGEVLNAYSYDDVKIPVAGAEVFAPGQVRERVDNQGRYKISSLGAGSTFVLDVYAPEHWGTKVISETQRVERIPLFSDKMMQSLFNLVGEPANNTEFGVIWGEVKRKKKPVAGVTVAIGTSDVIGPIYFNELRIPDKKLTKTSSNGLFAFLKVPPGLNTITTKKDGFELPSRVVATGPSLVSYTEINLKSLTLEGRVFDPGFKQNIVAQIHVIGSSYGVTSNAEGFKLKMPSTDSVIHIDAKVGSDYLQSRVAIPRSETKDIQIPVIRKDWLADAMNKAQIKNGNGMGLLYGTVTGPQFHVSFENEKIAEDQVFYFDKNGDLVPDAVNTSEEGGAFLVLNLKAGLHTAILTSADGQMMKTHIFVAESGVLNVIDSDLRP